MQCVNEGNTQMKILIANLGSTSFKYRLFDLSETPGSIGAEKELASGGVERIGAAESRVYASIGSSKLELTMAVSDHAVALHAALEQLTQRLSRCSLQDHTQQDVAGIAVLPLAGLPGREYRLGVLDDPLDDFIRREVPFNGRRIAS